MRVLSEMQRGGEKHQKCHTGLWGTWLHIFINERTIKHVDKQVKLIKVYYHYFKTVHWKHFKLDYG